MLAIKGAYIERVEVNIVHTTRTIIIKEVDLLSALIRNINYTKTCIERFRKMFWT
jgi:hypothetical protein